MTRSLLTLLLIPAALALGGETGEVRDTLPPFPEIGVVLLRRAVADGTVAASGEKPRSYRGIELVLRNRTEGRLAVDLCGSWLRPRRRGSVQRLGLGPVTDPLAAVQRGSGTIVVNLEPREIRRVSVNTVCLDAGRPAPKHNTYVAATDPLPPVRETVLRWWADNPHAPQGAVNSAIWQNRDTVVLAPGDSRPKGRFAAARGGTYYRLDAGELTSVDPDGIRRFLGTEIYRVIPADGAVYAVAVGQGGRPELWRLALTGEKPWGRLAAVDARLLVRDVFSGPAGLFLVTSRAVQLLDTRAGAIRTILFDDGRGSLSAWPAAPGRLLVAATDPGTSEYRRGGEDEKGSAESFVLTEIVLRDGRAEAVRRFWTVREMAVGPAGVFGVSHKGELRRLAGKHFRAFGPDTPCDRIVGVGRKGVWIRGSDAGKLAYVDADTGAARFEVMLPAAAGEARVDPVTDDLAVVAGDDYLRVSGEDGTIEKIP